MLKYTIDKYKPTSFILDIFLTGRCNLSCDYCYAERNKHDLDFSVAKKIIEEAFEYAYSNGYREMLITFEGGEPTLTFDLMKAISLYARYIGKEIFHDIHFQYCTNATLFDKKMIIESIKYNLFPVLSINDVEKPNSKRYKVLKLFNESVFLFDKFQKDYQKVEFRVTFTPKTYTKLSRIVKFVVSQRIINKGYIIIMPMMAKKDLWQSLKQDELKSVLESQFIEIADILIHNKGLRIGVNECLNPSAYLSVDTKFSYSILSSNYHCGAGYRHIASDMFGNFYPCYLFSSSPSLSMDLRIGNIYTGIKHSNAFNKFYGNGCNDCFSCRYWNAVINKDPDNPVMIYRYIFNAWLKALRYISRQINSGCL